MLICPTNLQTSHQSFWPHGLDFWEHTFFWQHSRRRWMWVDIDHNLEPDVQTVAEEMESMDDAAEAMDSSGEYPEISPKFD